MISLRVAVVVFVLCLGVVILTSCSKPGIYSQISIISVPVNTDYRDE